MRAMRGAEPPGSAQEWVAARVRAVGDGVLVRGDGVPWGVVRVDPAAVSLLSDAEQAARVRAVREALMGLGGAWQAVSVQRPVDLDAYLRGLDEAVAASAGLRRVAARDYRDYVRGLVSGGEATERRHYLLVGPAREARWSEADAQAAASRAAQAVSRAGLAAWVAEAAEIADLLATRLQPARRADERVEAPAAVPMWGGGLGA